MLWVTGGLIVLALILAFENILTEQTYYVLFFQVDLSSTWLILLSVILGFFIGFCFMLYAFEIRREKELGDQDDIAAAAPATRAEQTPLKEEPKEEKPVDEDDEVLE